MFNLRQIKYIPGAVSTPLGQDSIKVSDDVIISLGPTSGIRGLAWTIDSPPQVFNPGLVIRARVPVSVGPGMIMFVMFDQTPGNEVPAFPAPFIPGISPIGIINPGAPVYIRATNTAVIGTQFEEVSFPAIIANYTSVPGARVMCLIGNTAAGDDLEISCSRVQGYQHHVATVDSTTFIYDQELTPDLAPYCAWAEDGDNILPSQFRIAVRNGDIIGRSINRSRYSANTIKKMNGTPTPSTVSTNGVWAPAFDYHTIMSGSQIYRFDETVFSANTQMKNGSGLTDQNSWDDVNCLVNGNGLVSSSFNSGWYYNSSSLDANVHMQNINDVYRNRNTRVLPKEIRQITITPPLVAPIQGVASLKNNKLLVACNNEINLVSSSGNIIGTVSLAAGLGALTIQDIDFKDNLLYVLDSQQAVRIYRVL